MGCGGADTSADQIRLGGGSRGFCTGCSGSGFKSKRCGKEGRGTRVSGCEVTSPQCDAWEVWEGLKRIHII